MGRTGESSSESFLRFVLRSLRLGERLFPIFLRKLPLTGDRDFRFGERFERERERFECEPDRFFDRDRERFNFDPERFGDGEHFFDRDRERFNFDPEGFGDRERFRLRSIEFRRRGKELRFGLRRGFSGV